MVTLSHGRSRASRSLTLTTSSTPRPVLLHSPGQSYSGGEGRGGWSLLCTHFYRNQSFCDVFAYSSSYFFLTYFYVWLFLRCVLYCVLVAVFNLPPPPPTKWDSALVIIDFLASREPKICSFLESMWACMQILFYTLIKTLLMCPIFKSIWKLFK